jgi:ABC-2 type transport system ATP-binding protein
MWAVIKKLVEADVTILLTTQYLDEADQLADSIAVLDGGKIIAEGTADELKQRVGKERLVLTIKNSDDFSKAVGVVNGDAILTDTEARTISVALDGGVAEIKTILDKLGSNNIAVETMSMQKPTLDDVFMQLTGHHAEVKTAE